VRIIRSGNILHSPGTSATPIQTPVGRFHSVFFAEGTTSCCKHASQKKSAGSSLGVSPVPFWRKGRSSVGVGYKSFRWDE